MKFFVEMDPPGTYVLVEVEDKFIDRILSPSENESIRVNIVGIAYASNLEENLRKITPLHVSRFRGHVIGLDELYRNDCIGCNLEYRSPYWHLSFDNPINRVYFSPHFSKEFLEKIITIYLKRFNSNENNELFREIY
mgnify:CR=1 FL=1|jgi:hypothetical protein